MKRDEFAATIGYQGDTAIVDKRLFAQLQGTTIAELLEKGLYRAAFCAALYEDEAGGQPGEAWQVLNAYNLNNGQQIESLEDLKRLFGVFGVPAHVRKVSLIG